MATPVAEPHCPGARIQARPTRVLRLGRTLRRPSYKEELAGGLGGGMGIELKTRPDQIRSDETSERIRNNSDRSSTIHLDAHQIKSNQIKS